MANARENGRSFGDPAAMTTISANKHPLLQLDVSIILTYVRGIIIDSTFI